MTVRDYKAAAAELRAFNFLMAAHRAFHEGDRQTSLVVIMVDPDCIAFPTEEVTQSWMNFLQGPTRDRA